MKIRVTFKNPDVLEDAISDAVNAVPKPDGIDADEWQELRLDRAVRIRHDLTNRWCRFGEYITVEFDTDTNTAVVVPR